MASRRLAAARRMLVLAVAFGVGLAVADRMMTAQSIADEPTVVTTKPAEVAATRPALSAEVQATLDRVTAAYAELPLDLAGTMSQDFEVAGIGRRDRTAIRATVRSASTFRHEFGEQTLLVADGSKTHVYDPQGKRYVDRAIDAAGGRPTVDAEAMAILAMQNPAAAVAVAGDAAVVLVPEGATLAWLIEPATEGDRTFDRLEVRIDGARSETWIDRATGRVDRAIVDYAEQLARAGATGVERATVTIQYDAAGPATAPSMADDRFAFVPPKGASVAKAGGKAIVEGGTAPAFTLDDLDGKSVKLADLRGNVVVLDFWATWCGPCRQSLPHLAEAASAYADRGVRVYAVNREESDATIRDYLKKANLPTLPVLLDADGAVSQSYKVEGIPFTVIIDARGKVTKTILGFGPGGEATLRQAIDAALLAGTKPAEGAEPVER